MHLWSPTELWKWKLASVVSPTAATFHFYKSFWSVLRSQALETPQLGFRELNEPDLPWPLQPPEPVEPDLALHQSLLKPLGTFSGTFSGTLLNLTWLCTKASRNLLRNILRNPVEPDLALYQSLPEPSPEPCWTWPGPVPKPPGTFSGTFSGTLLNLDLALHQSLPDLLNLLRNLLQNLLRNPVEPDLALHQSLPDLLRNLLRNPVEPDLAAPKPPKPKVWAWVGKNLRHVGPYISIVLFYSQKCRNLKSLSSCLPSLLRWGMGVLQVNFHMLFPMWGCFLELDHFHN